MSQADEDKEAQQVWKTLSEAGLVEIRLDDFTERLGDVKRLVIARLCEFLNIATDTQECESAARSLGALKGLELKLQASSTPPSKPSKD